MSQPYLKAVRCTDCNELVALHRGKHGSLYAACGCDEQSVKVSEKINDGWSA